MVTSLESSITNDTITLTWMVGYSTWASIIDNFVFTNEGLYISQPPPASSRPPVTGYKISHNITGSVMVIFTSETKFVIENVAPGVYFFTVIAVNVLGNGKEESMLVMGGWDKHCCTTEITLLICTCVHVLHRYTPTVTCTFIVSQFKLTKVMN